MPPLVPATVSAKVPDVVIGDPATEISPPVNVSPTLVTVPVPVTVFHVGSAPVFAVRTWPVVPLAIVAGAVPAPPPMTTPWAAKAALVAQVDALEKYGIPPEFPATVKASVPAVVMGEPETVRRPPVNVSPTLVTVPLPLPPVPPELQHPGIVPFPAAILRVVAEVAVIAAIQVFGST